MRSCAIDNYFSFNWELFSLWVKFVNAHAANNLACIILDEAFEFNVVS